MVFGILFVWNILGYAQVGGVIMVLVLETEVASYGLPFLYVLCDLWSIWRERNV
jgi:hypothetical protein